MAVQPQVIDNLHLSSSQRSKLPSSSHRLPTVSAAEALLELQSNGPRCISTHLSTLDGILTKGAAGGGFEKGKVTEIWGPSGAGKTGLALQTAGSAVARGEEVVWVDASTSLSGPRLQSILEDVTTTQTSTLQHRFQHIATPTLSHLLALVAHPPPLFPADNTTLLVIDGLRTLVDLDYPRYPYFNASSHKSEAQKWQAGRRYAVLGSLIAALNKLAALNDIAVVITTGCATRMRNGTGMGAVLVPGVGGSEWETGIWSRLVVFRDFNGRFIGITKAQGARLVAEEGIVGRIVSFNIDEAGSLKEYALRDALRDAPNAEQPAQAVAISPAKPRKRTYDEIADSDGEDEDEFGWADEDAIAAEGLLAVPDAIDDAGGGVG